RVGIEVASLDRLAAGKEATNVRWHQRPPPTPSRRAYSTPPIEASTTTQRHGIWAVPAILMSQDGATRQHSSSSSSSSLQRPTWRPGLAEAAAARRLLSCLRFLAACEPDGSEVASGASAAV